MNTTYQGKMYIKAQDLQKIGKTKINTNQTKQFKKKYQYHGTSKKIIYQ